MRQSDLPFDEGGDEGTGITFVTISDGSSRRVAQPCFLSKYPKWETTLLKSGDRRDVRHFYG